MDLNLIVLAGRLAAPPEHRSFDSGASMIRYLVTIRSEQPRQRVDVIPVIEWGEGGVVPSASQELETGDRVWVAGTLQRRFWATPDGRRSRLEVIARDIQRGEPDLIGMESGLLESVATRDDAVG